MKKLFIYAITSGEYTRCASKFTGIVFFYGKSIYSLSKSPNKVHSYKSISLLKVMSNMFGKLHPIITKKYLISNHQYGFGNRHSNVEQVHRIVNTIEWVLKKKGFDRVFYLGSEYKVVTFLPNKYTDILIFTYIILLCVWMSLNSS